MASPKDVPQPGSEPVAGKQSGSRGPFDDQEPTASPGGLTSKGSASPGGPKADTVTQHFSKNAVTKGGCKEAHQKEKVTCPKEVEDYGDGPAPTGGGSHDGLRPILPC